MKNLINEVSKITEASQKEYEDALKAGSYQERTRLMKNAKKHENDPNDPDVLVRGFGKMREAFRKHMHAARKKGMPLAASLQAARVGHIKMCQMN